VKNEGYFDVIMMGIGADGHFCANLPETNCLQDYTTRIVTFDIPDKGIIKYATMGAQSVMASKHLLLIVNGEHKAEILKQALEGPVDEKCPSSVLKLHPNFTVIADEAVAKLLTK
ncbi:MAG: 6-phosphogluconolactonase, partial [Coprobacillaceae bacterium]